MRIDLAGKSAFIRALSAVIRVFSTKLNGISLVILYNILDNHYDSEGIL
ncbi:MAG: hypothetical protein WB217_18365 [Mesobacillus sp.]